MGRLMNKEAETPQSPNAKHTLHGTHSHHGKCKPEAQAVRKYVAADLGESEMGQEMGGTENPTRLFHFPYWGNVQGSNIHARVFMALPQHHKNTQLYIYAG